MKATRKNERNEMKRKKEKRERENAINSKMKMPFDADFADCRQLLGHIRRQQH